MPEKETIQLEKITQETYEEAFENKIEQLKKTYETTITAYIDYMKDRDSGKYCLQYFHKEGYMVYTKSKKVFGFKKKP